MGVNSLPKTVTRPRRNCDLNPGHSAPESSTLTTRLPSHPLAVNRSRGKCPVRAVDSISLGVRRSAAAFTTTSGRLITDHVHAPSFVLYRRPGLDVLRIACEQPTGRLDRNDKKSLTRRQRLRRSMTQGRLHKTSVSVVGHKGHNVRWPRRALLVNRKRIKR